MNKNKIYLNNIKKNFNDDALSIQGSVSMAQGPKILVNNVHNHFVDAGLKGILGLLLSGRLTYWHSFRFPSYNWNIYLGTDTEHVTTSTMNSLTAPIGDSPGTAPNLKSVPTVHDGGGDGKWYAVYQATWNAHTISGTVGEAALYMVDCLQTTFRWSTPNTTSPTPHMFSRLSKADADFDSFIIDEDVPLVVEWKLGFCFDGTFA